MPSTQSSTSDRRCPDCGALLRAEGDSLRCAEHGLFFSYGPRRLVRVAPTAETHASLMPWQTLDVREPLELAVNA